MKQRGDSGLHSVQPMEWQTDFSEVSLMEYSWFLFKECNLASSTLVVHHAAISSILDPLSSMEGAMIQASGLFGSTSGQIRSLEHMRCSIRFDFSAVMGYYGEFVPMSVVPWNLCHIRHLFLLLY